MQNATPIQEWRFACGYSAGAIDFRLSVKIRYLEGRSLEIELRGLRPQILSDQG